MKKMVVQKSTISVLLSFLLMTTLLYGTMTPANAAAGFSDVPSGKWYTQAVFFCAEKGYVSGYENGTFRPNNKLTRAEMAVIMNKMLGLKESANNAFDDVASGKWYTDPVLHCVKAGVMTGYNDKRFGTSDTLTREQGAVILAKALDVTTSSGRTGFTDDASISKWAVESVKAMNAKGLITGMGNNRFEPKTPLTRAQMCQIIYAAQEKSEEQPSPSPAKEEDLKPTESAQPVPAVKPDEVHAGDVEEETTDKGWPDLQKEYKTEEGIIDGRLIDVDGDNDLELITFSENGPSNAKLITYHNGTVSVLPLNGAGFGYVPGNNAILVAEYIKDKYTLSIYAIEKGIWVKKSSGSFQDPPDGPIEDDEGNAVHVNYTWNDEPVTEEEFYLTLATEIDVVELIQIDPAE